MLQYPKKRENVIARWSPLAHKRSAAPLVMTTSPHNREGLSFSPCAQCSPPLLADSAARILSCMRRVAAGDTTLREGVSSA